MKGNINEFYSVDGPDFKTIDVLRAIEKAKERALADKQPKRIYLNGNPYALVDRRGTLVAA